MSLGSRDSAGILLGFWSRLKAIPFNKEFLIYYLFYYLLHILKIPSCWLVLRLKPITWSGIKTASSWLLYERLIVWKFWRITSLNTWMFKYMKVLKFEHWNLQEFVKVWKITNLDVGLFETLIVWKFGSCGFKDLNERKILNI